MKSLLSLSVQEDRLRIVQDFTNENGKTKDLAQIVKAFTEEGKRLVIVMKDDDAMLRRAAKNIPYVRVLAYDKLSAKELLYAKTVLMLEGAARNLNEFFAE
jgi:large subunit ribosomal protein L4